MVASNPKLTIRAHHNIESDRFFFKFFATHVKITNLNITIIDKLPICLLKSESGCKNIVTPHGRYYARHVCACTIITECYLIFANVMDLKIQIM